MIRHEIITVLQKPAVRIKLLLISLLFVFALIEQVYLTADYTASLNHAGEMTVLALLLHTFSYFEFYQGIFLLGLFLLISDIAGNEYIERKALVCRGSRIRAARAAILRIVLFSVLYVVFFLVIAVVIAVIGIHNFSLEWPRFMVAQDRKIAINGVAATGLVNLPIGTVNYSPLVVLLLLLLRATLGFIFLGLLAHWVTQVTGKLRNGVGVLAAMIVVACLANGLAFNIWLDFKPEGQRRTLIQFAYVTIKPLFASVKITDSFLPWTLGGIIAGALLCALTAFGILRYYRKGDLGDADRDE